MIFFVILIAIGLHILGTFVINGTRIRVCLSDLIIPFFILYFVILLIREKRFPKLIVEKFWLSIFLMTLWITVSVVNGYYYSGQLLVWAAVNKYLGWFLLMSYLLAGINIGMMDESIKKIFLKWFISIAWLICTYEILLRFFNKFG